MNKNMFTVLIVVITVICFCYGCLEEQTTYTTNLELEPVQQPVTPPATKESTKQQKRQEYVRVLTEDGQVIKMTVEEYQKLQQLQLQLLQEMGEAGVIGFATMLNF